MKQKRSFYILLIAFTAAIGGFLLGFDGSVISGAAPFYKNVFGLEDGSFLFGFSVSCLIWGCIFGNFFAGPVSDRIGRKPTLLIAAFLFVFSSLVTALAPNIGIFISGRILAGVGVGFAILVAPVYIAEIAPPKKRGSLVSFNQLLIVIGLSSAYFSNYFIMKLVDDPLVNWRWMLGVEAFPSVMYFLLLLLLPESPRWLVMKDKPFRAKQIMERVGGREHAEREYVNIMKSLSQQTGMKTSDQFRELFSSKMRLILIIGFGLAVFQQVSGINSVLYYAPMIFESAGSLRDAAFIQAIAIGIVFLVMTVVSILIIDRLGRKPLLYIGVTIMTVSLFITGNAFRNATFRVEETDAEAIATHELKNDIWNVALQKYGSLTSWKDMILNSGEVRIVTRSDSLISLPVTEPGVKQALSRKENFLESMKQVEGKTYDSELHFKNAVREAADSGSLDDAENYLSPLLKAGIQINALLVLISILGFIAGFSLSLGPVMWAMFSEIFPNRLRGLAISVFGTVNSFTSFLVATFFPVQLKWFGSSATFFIYAGFMFACLIFVWRYVVETKGKSLEELEEQLIIEP